MTGRSSLAVVAGGPHGHGVLVARQGEVVVPPAGPDQRERERVGAVGRRARSCRARRGRRWTAWGRRARGRGSSCTRTVNVSAETVYDVATGTRSISSSSPLLLAVSRRGHGSGRRPRPATSRSPAGRGSGVHPPPWWRTRMRSGRVTTPYDVELVVGVGSEPRSSVTRHSPSVPVGSGVAVSRSRRSLSMWLTTTRSGAGARNTMLVAAVRALLLRHGVRRGVRDPYGDLPLGAAHHGPGHATARRRGSAARTPSPAREMSRTREVRRTPAAVIVISNDQSWSTSAGTRSAGMRALPAAGPVVAVPVGAQHVEPRLVEELGLQRDPGRAVGRDQLDGELRAGWPRGRCCGCRPTP